MTTKQYSSALCHLEIYGKIFSPLWPVPHLLLSACSISNAVRHYLKMFTRKPYGIITKDGTIHLADGNRMGFST